MLEHVLSKDFGTGQCCMNNVTEPWGRAARSSPAPAVQLRVVAEEAPWNLSTVVLLFSLWNPIAKSLLHTEAASFRSGGTSGGHLTEAHGRSQATRTSYFPLVAISNVTNKALAVPYHMPNL